MPSWLVLGILLVALDAVLLAAHVLHQKSFERAILDSEDTAVTVYELLDGDRDGSLVELFGQLQLGAAALILFVLAVQRTAHGVLAVWAVIFLFMMADDFFMLHERAGRTFDAQQGDGMMFGMAASQVGELRFWAVSVSALGVSLLCAYLASSRVARRGASWMLFIVVPLVVTVAAYALVKTYLPDLLTGTWAASLTFARMTVKLLTTTGVLIQSARLCTVRQ